MKNETVQGEVADMFNTTPELEWIVASYDGSWNLYRCVDEQSADREMAYWKRMNRTCRLIRIPSRNETAIDWRARAVELANQTRNSMHRSSECDLMARAILKDAGAK